MAGVGSLTVNFSSGTNPGLVITNGALTNLNATVTGTFMVAGSRSPRTLSGSYTTQDRGSQRSILTHRIGHGRDPRIDDTIPVNLGYGSTSA